MKFQLYQCFALQTMQQIMYIANHCSNYEANTHELGIIRASLLFQLRIFSPYKQQHLANAPDAP